MQGILAPKSTIRKRPNTCISARLHTPPPKLIQLNALLIYRYYRPLDYRVYLFFTRETVQSPTQLEKDDAVQLIRR
jgi:hypothetical protein